MSDNKNLRDDRDRSRVDGSSEYELRYIADKHGVTIDEVKRVIEKVGNDRQKIEEQLKSGSRG